MENYVRQRIFKIDELGPHGKELLLKRLQKINSVAESTRAAFDVTDLIHVAQSEDDLDELERLVCLISHSSVTDVSSFLFGASLLRLYHYLNNPQRAYGIYNTEVCRSLLTDNTCHKILMDLLFNNQEYFRVLEVFSTLRRYNIDCATLVFGAYFHINTAPSAQEAVSLMRKLQHLHSLSQRAIHFVTMLCLKQHLTEKAARCLNHCKRNNVYVNLELMCTAQLQRLEDVLEKLHNAKAKSDDMTDPLNTRIYSDVMKEVKMCIFQSGSEKQKEEFLDLEEKLAFNGALSQQTLSALLNRTVVDGVALQSVRGKRSHIG